LAATAATVIAAATVRTVRLVPTAPMVPTAPTVPLAQRELPVLAVTVPTAKIAALVPKQRELPQTMAVSANHLTDIGDNYFYVYNGSDPMCPAPFLLEESLYFTLKNSHKANPGL